MRNAEMSVVTLLFFERACSYIFNRVLGILNEQKCARLTDSLMDCLIDNVFCVVQAESITLMTTVVILLCPGRTPGSL